MPVFLKIEILYDKHPDLLAREQRSAIAAGHFAGGRYWAERLLPDHFKPSARSEFGYAERTGKYQNRKQKLAKLGLVEDGGRQALVFSGATRRATRLALNMVKATDKEVDVTIPVPRYITTRPNRYARHALANEILAMSPRHEKLVTTETERGFNRHMRDIRAAKRTVITS
jgi:hypothetical protein